MVSFNAIDVETANPSRSSICAIGIVQVRDGRVVNEWESLVNPRTPFNPRNVRVHGIQPRDVTGSPTMRRLHRPLIRLLAGHALVSHTSFDRTAMNQAFGNLGAPVLPVTWLDSAKIADQAWPGRFRSRKLDDIARELGIKFRHHRALDDARAAARVVMLACTHARLDINGWLERVNGPTRRR